MSHSTQSTSDADSKLKTNTLLNVPFYRNFVYTFKTFGTLNVDIQAFHSQEGKQTNKMSRPVPL